MPILAAAAAAAAAAATAEAAAAAASAAAAAAANPFLFLELVCQANGSIKFVTCDDALLKVKHEKALLSKTIHSTSQQQVISQRQGSKNVGGGSSSLL